MDRDRGNKTQRLYGCCSSYALSKRIVDNGLEDLWGRENPDLSEFTCCNRSSGTSSRIGRVYTDVKIASDKIASNHIMIAFIDHYNAISAIWLHSKPKSGKDLWYFNNSLLWKLKFSSTTKIDFLSKTQKKPF